MPVSLAEHFAATAKWARDPMPVNRTSHNQIHGDNHVVWQNDTLTTTVGTRWYPPFSGSITAVTLNIAATGASDTTCDLLINGTSVFTTGFTIPTIIAGKLYSFFATPNSSGFSFENNDYLQFQIVATGSATGPLVATLIYHREI